MRDNGASAIEFQSLHRALYAEPQDAPPDVFYTLLCFVTVGFPLEINDPGPARHPLHPQHRSEPVVFANDGQNRRELSNIPGTCVPHHALVCRNTSNKYSEFVCYHGERAYPAFLLAYKRS